MMGSRDVFFLFFVFFACLPCQITACGGFFGEPARPVVQSGEAIVFGVHDDGVDNSTRVSMQVQILYEGPAEAFSWILPLPAVPSLDVGSELLFRSLFRQTLPTFVLQIDEASSDTCTPETLEDVQCFSTERGDLDDAEAEMEEDGAVVLDQGSVGPFDFVILEAAEGNPSSVLTWLEDNGYDQPPGSAPLLNYYAVNQHKFVALRLKKEAETGDIQPIILSYKMPVDNSNDENDNNNEDEDVEVFDLQGNPVDEEDEANPTLATTIATARRALACVPLQLTSIAATTNMPIQVYVLGEARAVPLNFVEIQLDDAQVDWVGCLDNPGCYDDDYRLRFDQAAFQLVNQSFITEYAGSTDVMANQTALGNNITKEMIASSESFGDFLRNYRDLLPTDLPLLDNILEEYYESEFDTLNEFNATALADEIDTKILQPAEDAQFFVDSFSYLTRLYGRLSPDQMTKDPFFAFKPELPPVDNVHRAIGVPICNEFEPTALAITVTNHNNDNVNRASSTTTIEVPAFTDCNGWVPAATSTTSNNNTLSPAIQLSSWGFAGDDGVVVQRQDDGSFDMAELYQAVLFGDSLVMDQTVPEYSASDGDSTSAAITTNTDVQIGRDMTTPPGTPNPTEDTDTSTSTEGSDIETDPSRASSAPRAWRWQKLAIVLPLVMDLSI